MITSTEGAFLDYELRWRKGTSPQKAWVHPVRTLAAILFYAEQNKWSQKPAKMYPATRGPRGGIKIVGRVHPFGIPRIVRDYVGSGSDKKARSYLESYPEIKYVSTYFGDNFAHFIEMFDGLFGIEEQKIGWSLVNQPKKFRER